jgi:hypothetical protein
MLILCVLLAQPPAVGQPFTYEFTTSPAPAANPSLRYALLPKLNERTTGNSAVGYLRSAVLRPAWPRDPKLAQELNDRWARWDELLPNELPPEDVRGHLKKYRDALRELDEAARFNTCDWQQAGRVNPADIEGFLNTVQVHRELTRLQSLNIKLAIADGKFDEAVRQLATGLQHAKHVGEGPGVIQLLVGSAMANIILMRTLEFIRTPNSPNLYWALTTLPKPLIDPAPALEAETLFAVSFFAGLKELEAGPVSEDAANRFLDEAIRNLSRGAESDSGQSLGFKKLADSVARSAYVAGQGPPAKKDLLARGFAKAKVEAMPGAQAIVLRAAARHRELWDDQVKQFYLPYPAGLDGMAAAQLRVKTVAKQYSDDLFFSVMALVYPALAKVYEAQHMTERRIAQLRVLEAIRLDAALHGAVPEKLADIAAVPVPDDPRSGKPFVYEKTGANSFTLLAPPSPVGLGNFAPSAVFVVTLK